MDFTQITDVNSADFKSAMDIYSDSFPENERHPIDVITNRVALGLNQIYVGRREGETVFMALLWPLKNSQFILLDYMATDAAHRGKNIGSHFLKFMQEKLQSTNHYFILEVENPASGDNQEDRQKRVSFYKRNGAKELKGVRYVLPPLQGDDPTDMILMIFPFYEDGKIEAQLVKNLITQIYRELYGRDADSLFENWSFRPSDLISLT